MVMRWGKEWRHETVLSPSCLAEVLFHPNFRLIKTREEVNMRDTEIQASKQACKAG